MNDYLTKLYDFEFQQKLSADPDKYARELGFDGKGVEFKVVRNTKNLTYIAVETSTQDLLNDIDNIQAAGSSTVSSAGSASSIGTVTSSVSSGSSAATLSTHAK